MRTAIFPKGKQAAYETYGYSAAIISDGFVFVSGQVGIDRDGNAIADPSEQIHCAFDNLKQVLDAAHCTFDDVIDVTTFHVNMHENFEYFALAKRKTFPEQPYPNWTAIGITSLADPALLLEIKVIARIPKTLND